MNTFFIYLKIIQVVIHIILHKLMERTYRIRKISSFSFPIGTFTISSSAANGDFISILIKASKSIPTLA